MSTAPTTTAPRGRRLKRAAYGLGAVAALAVLLLTFLPGGERLHAKGPANTGHDNLQCVACHKKAAGTLRQQVQAQVGYALGWRATGTAFGHHPVGNGDCLGCHERAQDVHPVYRFLEPRFEAARASFGAHECVSCHREHQGVRVTSTATTCEACHQKMSLKTDPLDVPHSRLVAENRWTSCLGCHDYHGNHRRIVQTRVAEQVSPERIRDYFAGGASPYGNDRKFEARK